MDRELLIMNIQHYCKLRGEYPTRACEAAGVGKSFISSIRRGQTPSVASVAALAAYLGVTTSEILGERTNPDGHTDAARIDPLDGEIMQLLHSADPQTKRAIIVLLRLGQKSK